MKFHDNAMNFELLLKFDFQSIMITPPFQVTQDDDFVYIYMKIKYIKVRNLVLELANELFSFTSFGPFIHASNCLTGV